MLFKQEHKGMILKGTKTVTRRIWKKPRVKIGGIYKAKLKMLSKEYFAKIKVINYCKKELGDMTDEDAQKEGYPDIMAFHDVWIKINGTWNDNQIVDVIEFQLVKNQEVKPNSSQ